MNSLWLFWFSSYCTVHYNSKQNRRSYVTRHRQDPPAEMKKHSCDKNCSTSKHRRPSSDNFLLKFTTWKMVFVSKSVYLIRRKRLSLLWSLALLGDDSQLWVMVFGWDLRGLRSELQKTEEDGSRVTRRGLGLGCVCVCVSFQYLFQLGNHHTTVVTTGSILPTLWSQTWKWDGDIYKKETQTVTMCEFFHMRGREETSNTESVWHFGRHFVQSSNHFSTS